MPAAAVVAVAAVAKGVAARKAAKKQNQYLNDAAGKYDPSNINSYAQQYNPELYGAMRGERGTSGYQQSLYNLAQNPGYIDPALMNAPYLQSAQRQQYDLQAAQAMLGRNAMGGGTGLGNAYALANLTARTGRDVQTGQQYALWREQQRRSDLDWLSSQRQNAQQMGYQSAGGQANLVAQQQAPTPWLGVAGNAISSGMTAYGGMQGMASGGGGGMTSTGSWGQGPQLNPNAWKQSPYPNLQYQRT